MEDYCEPYPHKLLGFSLTTQEGLAIGGGNQGKGYPGDTDGKDPLEDDTDEEERQEGEGPKKKRKRPVGMPARPWWRKCCPENLSKESLVLSQFDAIGKRDQMGEIMVSFKSL